MRLSKKVIYFTLLGSFFANFRHSKTPCYVKYWINFKGIPLEQSQNLRTCFAGTLGFRIALEEMLMLH